MSSGFLPNTDAGLLAWAKRFLAFIAAAAELVGVTMAQITAFGVVVDAYETALAVATDPLSRTRGKIETKNQKREELKKMARQLAAIVQACPGTTNEQRYDMGLTVRKSAPSPSPVPSEAPLIDVLSIKGRQVQIRLRTSTDGRGRLSGTMGATVLTHFGPTPPVEPSAWAFAVNTGRTKLTLPVPPTASAETMWVTAFWYNGAKESGPASAPQSVNLPAAAGVTAAATMRLAA